MARKKNIGGIQIPLGFQLPETNWRVPTELPDLRRAGPDLAIDYETEDRGLQKGRGPGWIFGAGTPDGPGAGGRIVGVSMAAGDRRIYVPVAHPETECFDHSAVGRWVGDHVAGPQRKIFHNAAYDLGWQLAEWSVPPPDTDTLDDTMGMAYMLDEERLSFSLDSVCAWLGVRGKDEALLRQAADAYGLDPKSGLYRLPAKYVAPYAEQDAGATLEVAQRMRPMMEAQGVEAAYRLEMDLIPMCLEMRRRGVRVDIPGAEREAEALDVERDVALAFLTDKIPIGRAINIRDVSSVRFMARIFDDLGISYPQTAKGNPSFSAEWMGKSEHWLPQQAARALKLHDASEKFLRGYICGYEVRGRIHAEMHQFRDDRGGTRTTRFAYSDPPLQQMPSRPNGIADDAEIPRRIRGIFLPEPGTVWGALDYSQQEFRLMVHFASLCKLLGADMAVAKYHDDPDTDFHNLASELTRLPRRKAKDVNFAKAFGAGVPKFANMTGMSLEEARETMDQYDRELPFIARLSEFCQNRANSRGYVKLLDGARARFNRWEPRWIDWNRVNEARTMAAQEGRDLPLSPCSLEEARERVKDEAHPWSGRLRRAFTHKAMNYVIQGSAARQTKLAMREWWREGIIPMLQMHDELDGSFDDEATARRGAEIMRDVVQLEVPVKVDAEYGVNWGEAKYSWQESWKRAAA